MSNDDPNKTITRLGSDRLFFEPGETSSILEEARGRVIGEDGDVLIVAKRSNDPVLDFRVSMEDMVEDFGLRELESFEYLLACYLTVNDICNHSYIIRAFVGLYMRHFRNYPDDDDDEDEYCFISYVSCDEIEKDEDSSSSSSSSSSSGSLPKVSSSSI